MKKKEVNFTTTNLQLRTKKKNNLGHPTLPLYSITYLLHTKLASFGIFCQLWQKIVFAREYHQKEINDDVSPKHVHMIRLSIKIVLGICCHLTNFPNFLMFPCVSISVSANFHLCVLGKQKNSEKLLKWQFDDFYRKSKISAGLFPPKSFGSS